MKLSGLLYVLLRVPPFSVVFALLLLLLCCSLSKDSGSKIKNHQTAATAPARTMVLATSPGAGQHQNGEARKNTYARVIGSAAAGVSELLLFHPVDTVAKRLMSNQTVSVKGQRPTEAMAAFNKVCERLVDWRARGGRYPCGRTVTDVTRA